MKELHEKMKDVVQHAAGENELADEVLQEIAAGVGTDLIARFKKAEVPMSPSYPYASSDAPATPSSE
jgi:hypothetical protein